MMRQIKKKLWLLPQTKCDYLQLVIITLIYNGIASGQSPRRVGTIKLTPDDLREFIYKS